MSNNFPDWVEYGYEVLEELGRNREGGRITWKVRQIATDEDSVIKQFCFAQSGSDWSAYKAHEREITVLENLNHQGIPRYLESFETGDGFCLVQEYKNAPSLAIQRTFEPEEIKIIAIKILEILVYLQERIPPIIHRDIKPENILVDSDLNVYLIDFGLAKIGEVDVAASSVFVGTPGFIPPENLFKPTTASDLYSLGSTLICLLTGINSVKIQELTSDDNPYLLEFQHLLSRLSQRFLAWLQTMVEPNQSKRYQTAQEALEALKPLYIIRIPEAKLSDSVLEVTAKRLGEKISVPLQVNNGIPETVLEGKLDLNYKKNNQLVEQNYNSWITLDKSSFSSNLVKFNIKVDTGQLRASTTYERQLILQTNANPERQIITLKVNTAPIPINNKKMPYLWLSLLLFVSLSIPAEFQLVPVVYENVLERIQEIWSHDVWE
ncbi:MAG: serine/threonine protein kinase [Crocosphaera sp.]